MKKTSWKITPFFTDKRGTIAHLLPKKMQVTGALLITCNKGAVRANHYHKKDTHYSYMLSGKMEYTYEKIKDQKSKIKNPKKNIIVSAGEIVATPPMTMHAMKFLEKSVFVVLTTEERDQKKYERDTVRVKLIELSCKPGL